MGCNYDHRGRDQSHGPVLAGKPALVGAALILPLSDGSLGRVKLTGAKVSTLEPGLNWRARSLKPDARGEVVSLGGDRFLTTNGANGIRVWEWALDKSEPIPLPAGQPGRRKSVAR